MSVESKVFREALAKAKGSYCRVYTSTGKKGRRVKLYCVPERTFPLLERTAKELGSIQTKQMPRDRYYNVPSFVAWFPHEERYVPPPPKPRARFKEPSPLKHIHAPTTQQLVTALKQIVRENHNSTWGWCGSFLGVFDADNVIVAEIRNY